MIADLVIICKENLMFSCRFYKKTKRGKQEKVPHLTKDIPYNILLDCKWLGWEAVHSLLRYRELPVGARRTSTEWKSSRSFVSECSKKRRVLPLQRQRVSLAKGKFRWYRGFLSTIPVQPDHGDKTAYLAAYFTKILGNTQSIACGFGIVFGGLFSFSHPHLAIRRLY